MYSIKKAQISLLSNLNVWCSSFPGKIIFGEIDEILCFDPNKSFLFEKNDLLKLDVAITKIISSIATNVELKEAIILKNPNTIYYFEVKKKSVPETQILFSIEVDSDSVYRIVHSLDQFNDFIHILCQIILPIFCFDHEIENVFNLASNLSQQEILGFSDRKLCLEFLLKNNVQVNNLETVLKYFSYYQEFILLINKFKSLYNPEPKKLILEQFNRP